MCSLDFSPKALRRSGSCPALLTKLLQESEQCFSPNKRSLERLADWEVRALLASGVVEAENSLLKRKAPPHKSLHQELEPLERQVPSANLPQKRFAVSPAAHSRRGLEPPSSWVMAATAPELASPFRTCVGNPSALAMREEPRQRVARGPPLSGYALAPPMNAALGVADSRKIFSKVNASQGTSCTLKSSFAGDQRWRSPVKHPFTAPSLGVSNSGSALSWEASASSLPAEVPRASSSPCSPKRPPKRQASSASVSPKSAEAVDVSTQSSLRLDEIDRSAEQPARVAIIGAGPVGLWIAVMLAREHAHLFLTAKGFRISRPPQAPIINVFERRTDSSGWGSRRVVLAMSQASQDLLNGHLLTDRELFARHCFAPACSINLIESTLREEFEKYVTAGFGSLQLGKRIDGAEALIADHDVVFVATGRGWPDDEWRRGNGMQVSVGRTEEALILKFSLEPNPDLGKILTEVRGSLGRFEAPGQPTYILRPGPSEEQGWLWILGLGTDVLGRMHRSLEGEQQDVLNEMQGQGQEPGTAKAQPRGGLNFSSFREMWAGVTTSGTASPPASPSRKGNTRIVQALAYLDKQLRPVEVSPRISVASYWHSEEVVQRVERPDGTFGWIVLVGDAACGKPFYLGSNLNGHFQDAMALLAAPWSRWAEKMQDAAVQKGDGSYARQTAPFKRYMAEYRKRVDGIGFRSCAAKGKKSEKSSEK
eukprot:TRINITY_DN94131_c0_g1_i1.p1 TRINITY_DN94131_c0_g1~~TRINITY_DN94131_c0_g1_i1.p1  ORF type:complete len:710 (+),score=137.03 TRINITY_DN94131_c0_g1_i1:152-2281(+)